MSLMSVLQVINVIAVAIGIPAIVGAFISIGRKLLILEKLQTDVPEIKHNLFIVTNHLIRHDKEFNPSGLKS